MNRKLTASFVLAAAGFAAPALGAEIVQVYTVPATTTYYYSEPATTYYYTYTTPTVTETYTAPSMTYTTPSVTYTTPTVTETIIVTTPSLTEDQAITRDVVDVLAADPRLSGRIGVETRRNAVTLSGQVNSSRQIDIASRDAYGVPGVREVNNELRPRVGGLR